MIVRKRVCVWLRKKREEEEREKDDVLDHSYIIFAPPLSLSVCDRRDGKSQGSAPDGWEEELEMIRGGSGGGRRAHQRGVSMGTTAQPTFPWSVPALSLQSCHTLTHTIADTH